MDSEDSSELRDTLSKADTAFDAIHESLLTTQDGIAENEEKIKANTEAIINTAKELSVSPTDTKLGERIITLHSNIARINEQIERLVQLQNLIQSRLRDLFEYQQPSPDIFYEKGKKDVFTALEHLKKTHLNDNPLITRLLVEADLRERLPEDPEREIEVALSQNDAPSPIGRHLNRDTFRREQFLDFKKPSDYHNEAQIENLLGSIHFELPAETTTVAINILREITDSSKKFLQSPTCQFLALIILEMGYLQNTVNTTGHKRIENNQKYLFIKSIREYLQNKGF